MSNRELAKSIIDCLPEDKLIFIINILENIGEMSGISVHPEFTPNEETIKAMEEVDEMIRTGSGEHFSGTTADFFFFFLEE